MRKTQNYVAYFNSADKPVILTRTEEKVLRLAQRAKGVTKMEIRNATSDSSAARLRGAFKRLGIDVLEDFTYNKETSRYVGRLRIAKYAAIKVQEKGAKYE